MTRPIDPDIKALGTALRGLCGHADYRMRRATLEFLWSRNEDPKASWVWKRKPARAGEAKPKGGA